MVSSRGWISMDMLAGKSRRSTMNDVRVVDGGNELKDM